MSEKKPNHICRNPNCHYGTGGTAKRYWACEDSDRAHSWRSVACCPICYQEYMTAIEKNRSKPVLNKKDTILLDNTELSDLAVADTRVNSSSGKKKK